MLRLINFELRKLIRQRSFYIFVLVVIGIAVAFAFVTRASYDKVDVVPDEASGLFNMTTAIYSSSIDTVLGIFVAIIVCEDYAGGIVRNVLTRGYNRLSIYFSKYIVTLVAALILAVITLAAYYIVGNIMWGSYDGDLTYKLKLSFLCQLTLVIAYTTLFYAISSALQKTGGAVAICIMLPVILNLVLPLLDSALIKDANPDFYYSDYWLSKLLSSVSSITPETENINRGFICSGIYTAASLVIGWLTCFKREY